jgi:predicted MPP superfamily phosphohydrolase
VASATALGGTTLGGYTWLFEPHWLEIVRRPLPVVGLPPALRGATLVQLSDLHGGPRVPDEYILDAFARVRAVRPDIVAYTGDFTSYDATVFDHASRVYQDLPRGRLATVGVLGNHDYGPRWAHPEVAARLSDILRGFGLTILRNELTEVAGLQIVGLDDLWARHFDPVRGFASLDDRRPALVLSHNPDTADLDGWDRVRGWILSGHTHGGQCKPPFLPPPILPVENRRYTSGAFDLSGGRRMYISRGIGHVLQVRFNVRPEVTVFQLESA